jgi:hypothetical protein
MRFNHTQLKWHVLGCVAFLTLPMLLFPHPPEHSLLLFSRPTIRDLLGNGLMLLFFYCNYYVFIPTFYYRKQYILYSLIIILGFITIMYLPSLLTGHFNPSSSGEPMPGVPARPGSLPPPRGNMSFFEEVSHSIFLFASVVLFSILLAVRERLLQSEKAKHATELAYLKSQINPHFLFNTLNNIYSLALLKDDHAPDAIIRLSELMRYTTRAGGLDMVSLEEEINYISNYIALQEIRFGSTASIDYQVQCRAAGKQVAPLILVSFIENAFKHGINPDQGSHIKIDLACTDKTLSLLVFNKKTSVVRSNDESGIGLENTRARLNLLYSGRYSLLVEDGENDFTVKLTMQLT